MSEQVSGIVDEMARLAFSVGRPRSFKPYAVERLFREGVKAVKSTGTMQTLNRDDYVSLVSGRIQKAVSRGDQLWILSREKLGTELGFGERANLFAAFFVDQILYGLCDGKPGRLKKVSNNLSDGFFAATLREMRNQKSKVEKS
ncbi:MAG: type I-D CRISPR-associated protein Cas10d/Csc3, partial [Candidatus Methanospirareceae archaeon]